MSRENQGEDITKKRVIYRIPDMDRVTMRRDVEYRATDAGALTMDIFYPPDSKSEARAPALVFVLGYPDPGFQRMLGCKQKEMESYISWGQLVAALGLVAITYTNMEPEADIRALLRHIREDAASLGIDENRIGVWACSGNVPNALSLLTAEASGYLKCAVLCYGYMLDLGEETGVAEAASQWKFVNPCAGRTVSDLAQNISLFIARAGEDRTLHLNETIDRFVIEALNCNLPVTLANHSAGSHAFDLLEDNEASRRIIKQILAFIQYHLMA